MRRDLNDESNCICSFCLSKIHAYDWTCIKVKEQELELQTMLIATDKICTAPQTEAVYVDDFNNLYHSKPPLLSDVKVEEKQQVMTPTPTPPTTSVAPVTVPAKRTTTPPNNTPDAAKRSKPIIVRVVKRVPFLGSKPVIPMQANSTGKPAQVVKQEVQPTGNSAVKFESKPAFKLEFKLPAKKNVSSKPPPRDIVKRQPPPKAIVKCQPPPKANVKRQPPPYIPMPQIVAPKRVICQYCEEDHENECALEVICEYF